METISKMVGGQVRDTAHAEEIVMAACARMDASLHHANYAIQKRRRLRKCIIRVKVTIEDA